MTFGAYIKWYRQFWSLTQKQCAEFCKISCQYWNDLERDRRDAPSDAILEKIADELCINPDLLYYVAGRISSDLRGREPSEVKNALTAFRLALKGGSNG